MNRLIELMNKAQHSRFYLWLLNYILLRRVPFNKPHKLKITEVRDNLVEVRFPYRRSNLNHINGLHACGLATVAEFASGLLLLKNVDPKKYRLIMQSLEVTYHYQGKMDGIVRWSLDPDWLQQNAFGPLQEKDAVQIVPEVQVHDRAGNHLCTARISWQIKRWDKVKTAVQ